MALTMDEVTANCMEMIGYTGEGGPWCMKRQG